jgi:2-polyprenyl-3-methyl-5-hydroxy-6-metoxy-1,4-benzoquinol methylase
MSEAEREAPVGPLAAKRITACRFCGGALAIPFCDLGEQPVANSFIPPDHASEPEPRLPLAVRVCGACRLAQLDHIADERAIFSDYAYFSSVSASWLDHASRFCLEMTGRLALDADSFVVEVASNDGYLLRNFVRMGVPCLGVEPAANVAERARAAGVPTDVRFFGRAAAEEIVVKRGHADLVIANNVFAHVPDINDFVAGLTHLAGSKGVVSLESPHLARLIESVQFDTIYHEHYSYWSLLATERVLAAHGLAVFDVQTLPTHGGSLRVLAARQDSGRPIGAGLIATRAEEDRLGMTGIDYYAGFQPRIKAVIDDFWRYVATARSAGRSIAAYGAAAKGNTFLNAAGASAADITMVADANPVKQGRLLPGSRIPIVSPEELLASRPDDVLILPWNIADEIVQRLSPIATWGGRFVTAIPHLHVHEAGS